MSPHPPTPELIGFLLLKQEDNGTLLYGVIVEMETYAEDDPTCHGHRYRFSSNSTKHSPAEEKPLPEYLSLSAEKRLLTSWSDLSLWRKSNEDHYHSHA